jgi:D-sedoheptulose 7-phosphate isomerase
MPLSEPINDRIDGSLAAITALRDQADRIGDLSQAVLDRLRAGGTLYTAGNGGSATQALHLAEELIGRYRGDRPPLRAMCLNADPSAITSFSRHPATARTSWRRCRSRATAEC